MAKSCSNESSDIFKKRLYLPEFISKRKWHTSSQPGKQDQNETTTKKNEVISQVFWTLCMWKTQKKKTDKNKEKLNAVNQDEISFLCNKNNYLQASDNGTGKNYNEYVLNK